MAATSPVSDFVSMLINDEQDIVPDIERPGLAIRNVFSSVEHEIARDHETCSGCSAVRGFLEPKRWARPNESCRLTLPKLIHNSHTCWFCRFLSRPGALLG